MGKAMKKAAMKRRGMKAAAPAKAMKAMKKAAMKRRAMKAAAPAKAMKAMKKAAMKRRAMKAAAPAKAIGHEVNVYGSGFCPQCGDVNALCPFNHITLYIGCVGPKR